MVKCIYGHDFLLTTFSSEAEKKHYIYLHFSHISYIFSVISWTKPLSLCSGNVIAYVPDLHPLTPL